jgi:hypothetical protein
VRAAEGRRSPASEMDRLLSASLFLVVALLSFAAPTRAQTEAAEGPCPNKNPSIGEYRNLHHRFSIVIPVGLKGYWNSRACDSAATDHGRRIPLAIDATIEVFAFYDPMDFEFFPANGEHNEILVLRRNKHVSQVKRLRSGWFRLGDANAHRYAVQFRRDKKMFISDNVVVLYEHVVYELTLHTMAKRYEADKRLFEEIIASWRWTQRIDPNSAAEQSLAADGAIACFSSNFCPCSLNADRAQLMPSVRQLLNFSGS